MRGLHSIAVFALVVAVCPVSAQTPVLMGGGYASPIPFRAAPGQLVTLYVSGARTILPAGSQVVSASVPLPVSLAGFSVNLRQGGNTYAAPLFSVAQTTACAGSAASPGCIVTALTIQIPFELAASAPGLESPELLTEISVNEDGVESARFLLVPAVDNIHLLTRCDGIAGGSPSTPPCSGIVTHADGTLVTADSPAKASEIVVIYGFGFGRTTPPVKTGAPAPLPAPVVAEPIVVQFDFHPNAGPSRPYVNPLIMTPVFPGPVFAGLTPGQVGLYQLNVRIPDTLPAVLPCTRSGGVVYGLTGTVTSNLTINIAGLASFDGAAICVSSAQ
jgi:uncharacterized protein (TIGR03437 family)